MQHLYHGAWCHSLLTIYWLIIVNMQWASYQIRKIAGCACAGNAGNVFPRRRFQMKPLVSDPGMHHGTCVTHVPWCMSGSLTCGDAENIPGIPGACAPAILRIWQEAHSVHYGHGRITKMISCKVTPHHFSGLVELNISLNHSSAWHTLPRRINNSSIMVVSEHPHNTQ